jgi:hypothetical protein
VDIGIEDYNLLLEGNKSLLTEHNELSYRSEDLESELMKVHSNAAEDFTALKVKIRSVDAHSVNVAAVGEKCLRDFESELIKDLVGLRAFYEHNIQSIEGLCSPVPKSELPAVYYIHQFSAEVIGLPEVFAGMNKNSISAAVKGTLSMAGDSVDLSTLQSVAADSGADILPAERDVRRATRVVSRKWWCSFGYNYMLVAI